MRYRYATEADAVALARLFAANHHDALTEQQRTAQGFVQGTFDAATLRDMAAAGELLVADDGEGGIAGLLALSVAADMADPPAAVTGLLRAQSALAWRGRPLDEVPWLLYGPVVVDAAFRGQGVARGLFEKAVETSAGRAEALVAFIEAGNTPSWRVHVEAFGMTPLGDYIAAGRTYHAVATAAVF
ncbi:MULTISPECIES: GNAT family N-acetyltransferase [unclassified Streptomyces]|uniref:GNAT family N-acetyltransferase n=1 Tax=unclassified Streptomyces TaxID=2593676 RepID=UPI002E321152|nr:MULTISPECIES: GNAT family N-acetyltransferase [unclassified Streptomyces]WUC68324.1 GNAT family N-acetyltransferase [Streptomyces sp. NBC_00539]